MNNNETIGLVSDAGTPGISDPGAVVVQRAYEQGLTVVPLPGPSAVTTALSGSGLSSTGFLFLGFLPSKKTQRRKALTELINCEYPVVLYESPHRIDALLSDALDLMGDREAFWGRELTKKFEDLRRDSLNSLLQASKVGRNRGEFVVIICTGAK